MPNSTAPESRNPFLVGALAGALAMAMNEMIAHLPAYSDIVANIYSVSVFATVATMAGTTLFLSVKNPTVTSWQLSVGAFLTSTALFTLRLLLIRRPDLTMYWWWPVLPIIAHTIIVVPAAFIGPDIARRFRSRKPPAED